MAEADPSPDPAGAAPPALPAYADLPMVADHGRLDRASRVRRSRFTSARCCWRAYLLAAASDAPTFNIASAVFGSFLGQLVLFGYTFALMLHLLGGLRHAIWDAGKGFDPRIARPLSLGGFVGAGVLTILMWIVSFILR